MESATKTCCRFSPSNQVLTTHQVVTVVLPTDNGRVLRLRKGSTPEKVHREIYEVLAIPDEVMNPRKTWADS